MRKEAVATRFRVFRCSDIVSLIYQFGSNVNNRAITNAIAARIAGASPSFPSVSLSLSFSGDEVH